MLVAVVTEVVAVAILVIVLAAVVMAIAVVLFDAAPYRSSTHRFSMRGSNPCILNQYIGALNFHVDVS